MKTNVFLTLLIGLLLIGCNTEAPQEFDILIRNATIYDGSGKAPYTGMLAINKDTIAAIGQIENAQAKVEVDAQGKAVSPGFINMLSWGTVSLIHDGRGMSDIMQRITLEVMGQGWSMGPISEKMKVAGVCDCGPKRRSSNPTGCAGNRIRQFRSFSGANAFSRQKPS